MESDNKTNTENFLLYMCLKGDTSDNIPGVSGFGNVKIQKIVETYQNIESLYKHFEKPTIFDKSDKNFIKLLENQENIKISEKLLRLYNKEWRTNITKYAINNYV
jgi:DNA polymerase-1